MHRPLGTVVAVANNIYRVGQILERSALAANLFRLVDDHKLRLQTLPESLASR